MQTYKLNVKKIEELALRQGMSLARLCESTGMSRSRVSDWRNREVNPRTVYRIATALSVDPVELIVKEEP